MLFTTLAFDFSRSTGQRPTLARILKRYAANSGFRAVALFRVASYLRSRDVRLLPMLITAHCVSSTGAEILPEAEIGPGFVIEHPVGIVIGCGSVIGANCTVLQGVTLGEKYSPDRSHAYPHLGNGVTVCAGAALLGGITIGDGAIIGAHSVVLTDIPSNAIAVGAPARVVKAVAEGRTTDDIGSLSR